MNKPIIVDGVDISECENYFHTGNEENCEDYLDGVCQGHNCLYKQLQRLKAENEELKKECMQMVNENYASTDWRELEKLKKGNEELKTKIFDEGLRRKTCKYYKQVCSENTQLIAYRNALEEIQNILFPKNKLLITDCKGLLKTQEILNEVLKDE